MIYRFIQQHRQEFAVAVMCRVLGVSRSGYYAWESRPTSQRERANSHLVKEIRAVHAKSRQTYGSPRVFAELRANQVVCGRHRVARLMRQHGIVSQRRFKTTPDSQHASCPLTRCPQNRGKSSFWLTLHHAHHLPRHPPLIRSHHHSPIPRRQPPAFCQ